MKLEKVRISLTGALLAVAVSCGGAGCLWTGFDLNVVNPEALWLVCGLASLLCGLCLLWKWGGAAVLCLLAAWAGYLWHRGEAGTQILQLIYRISYGYDKAYDWGVLRFVDTPWNMGTADIPLQIIGCAVAIAVCHTVCRGKRTWPGVGVALIPLALCLVVTDTVPGEGSLFALLLGLVLLLLSASVRRTDRTQAARLVWLAALPAAIAMTLLFHLVPREGYVNKSEEVREKILTWVETLPEKVEDATREVAAVAQNGEEHSVNLKTLGRQSRLAYPVMEVTANWSGTLYLRGQDYDAYDGGGWTASPHRSEEFTYAGESAGAVQVETRSGWESRFLPYYPEDTQNLVGGSLDNPEKKKDYTISRSVLPDNWRALVRERSEGIWESEVEFTSVLEATRYLDSARYLLLPNETRTRAKQLLEDILEEERTATGKAEAIAAYVRASAVYDRDTGRMPSDEEDFALWFLEDSDTGYCVHFATAAVVLLRAADVPARYVTGYLAHCVPGKPVTVTADTAHAWAEYYEPQLACWIPLEATPAEGLAVGTVPEEEESRPAVTTAPEEETRQSSEPELTAPSHTQVQLQPSRPGTQEQEESHSLGWLWFPAVVLILLFQRPLRIALRRWHLRDSANERALGLWRQIVLMAKLRKQPPPREMKALAQKAKFSQHILTDEELAQMEEYIFDSVEDLKQRPWYRRLIYRYFYAVW